MPLLASRSEASTSWVLFPMDETMPIPVTTTRRIGAHHALDVDSVHELLHGRQNLTGEFHFADAERAAAAFGAGPAEKKADQVATVHRDRGSPASPDRP
jgi:hypothetical protein